MMPTVAEHEDLDRLTGIELQNRVDKAGMGVFWWTERMGWDMPANEYLVAPTRKQVVRWCGKRWANEASIRQVYCKPEDVIGFGPALAPLHAKTVAEYDEDPFPMHLIGGPAADALDWIQERHAQQYAEQEIWNMAYVRTIQVVEPLEDIKG